MAQGKQGNVTAQAAVVNLNGTQDVGTFISGGTWNGNPVAQAYIPSAPALGFGTVTSVDLTAPEELFIVSGNPITTAGTIDLAFPTKSANQVFAGPTSGEAVTPIFRALVAADIPALDTAKITTGTFVSARLAGSYTGITGVGTLSAGVVPFSLVTGTVPTTQGGTGLAVFTAEGVFYASSTSAVAQAAVNATATNKYLLQVSSGVPTFTQVAAADVSGLAASATTDTTNAANISSGTLPTGRLSGSYTGITAIGAATATSLTTGVINITGGAANTGFNTTGTDAFFKANSITSWTVDNAGVFRLGSGHGAAMVRSAVTGGVTFVLDNVSATTAAGIPSMAYDIDATGTNGSVPQTRSRYFTTSRVNAVTRTLPTPANSYVGQTVGFVQEASNVVTVGVPTGVTVTMKTGNSLGTGNDILTTKTATNFVSAGTGATDGTSATLLCTSTDTSTVATWRQICGVGDWT